MKPDEVRMLSYDYAIIIVKNAPPLVDRKINVFHYKKAAGTPMGGANDMEYIIPQRLKQAVPDPDAETAKSQSHDPYEDTAYGTVQEDNIWISVDGTDYDIADYDIAELVQSYSIDLSELENFMEQCLTKK